MPTMTASTIRRSRPTQTQGPSSRARFITDADGRFFFRTILPCSYPIPVDGPVGEMIHATKRPALRPAHVHFLVAAPGYQPLVTHVFIGGDPNIDCDVVFGVKDELIANIEKRTDPMMPDGKPAAAPWHLMTYEFRMKPGAGSRAETAGRQGDGSRLRTKLRHLPNPCAPHKNWANGP